MLIVDRQLLCPRLALIKTDHRKANKWRDWQWTISIAYNFPVCFFASPKFLFLSAENTAALLLILFIEQVLGFHPLSVIETRVALQKKIADRKIQILDPTYTKSRNALKDKQHWCGTNATLRFTSCVDILSNARCVVSLDAIPCQMAC